MHDKGTRRSQLFELLGDLPERNRKINVHYIAEKERKHYFLESLILDLNV